MLLAGGMTPIQKSQYNLEFDHLYCLVLDHRKSDKPIRLPVLDPDYKLID